LKTFPVRGKPFNYRYVSSGRIPGVPAWEVLDEVNLDEHITHHALPWPGGERELFDLVSRLDSRLLDRSRPLWEMHLIEGLEGGRYATFTRIHHALMDGKWGIRLAQATTSPSARARNLPPYWAVQFEDEPEPETLASGKRGRGRAGKPLAQSPASEGTLAELRKAFGRLADSYLHPADDGLVRYYTAPECMLNGKLTPRRELAVSRLELARVKAVAHANDATVNEVVLALCGGALRRYLLEHDDLPAKPLIANMPIAVSRPKGDSGGNAIISGIVSLATHVKDPIKRLQTIRGSSQHAKELVRDMPSQAALTVFMGVAGLPYILAQALGQAERAPIQNLVISNVPGLREQRYVNGARILAEYPMSLLVPGQAVNITVISHADMLDVAVLVCPSLVPNPQRIGAAIEESLDELERAAARRARGSAAKKKSRPRSR
jgi:diacylglycerol O-acyltransferase